MAARENQGYLIAVIILVLLTLVLALVAFMGISKATEYSDELKQMKTDLASSRKSSEAHQIQAQILKAYIGYKGGGTLNEAANNLNSLDQMGESVKTIRDECYDLKDEYDKDIQKYVSTSAGEDAGNTYKDLLANLTIQLGKQYNDKFVLQNEADRIRRESEAELKAKDELVKKSAENLTATEAKLDAEKIGRAADVKNLQTKLDEIQATNLKINQESENKVQVVEKKNSVLTEANTLLARNNQLLKNKVDEYEREVFDNPDGRILGVSPEIDMVVVNLGSADGLRPNRTFAVYDKHVTNFQKDKHKAMIEITRIVGSHQAEARITQEDFRNPILTADYILTATWDPGHSVAIALAGDFDLDSDGFSDLQRLINDIERNGGKVVAYHDENGDIVGKIDSSTRFFVLGTAPKTDGENYSKTVDAIRELGKQAEEYAVQEIDTKKLLDWMGRSGRARIERTDSRMGDQFRKREPADSLLRNDSDIIN